MTELLDGNSKYAMRPDAPVFVLETITSQGSTSA